MYLNEPYQFNGRGRTQAATLDDYVKQLMRTGATQLPGNASTCLDLGSSLLHSFPLHPTASRWPPPPRFRCRPLCRSVRQLREGPLRISAKQEAVLTLTVTYSLSELGRHAGADLRQGDSHMIYRCCNENRKAGVLESATLNGIDFLEVLDHRRHRARQPAPAHASGPLPEGTDEAEQHLDHRRRKHLQHRHRVGTSRDPPQF